MYPSLVPREGFIWHWEVPEHLQKIAPQYEIHKENVALLRGVHYENVKVEKMLENVGHVDQVENMKNVENS